MLGHLGTGAGLIATLRHWTRPMAWFTLAVTIVSVLLRSRSPTPSASSTTSGPPRSVCPPAALWLELSILRGVLQGVGDYKAVGLSLIGEQGARLITGAILAAAGLGVTGAYLGTPLSFIAMGAVLRVAAAPPDRARSPPTTLAGRAGPAPRR